VLGRDRRLELVRVGDPPGPAQRRVEQRAPVTRTTVAVPVGCSTALAAMLSRFSSANRWYSTSASACSGANQSTSAV
jgi:hypothetical protein